MKNPLDVLVLDGDQRQALVCVRSLGRLGLRVGAVAAERWAPAARSRFCSYGATLTASVADTAAVADEVRELVERYRPQVVIPGTDATVEALRLRRDDLAARTRLALPSEGALRLTVEKTQTLALAESLGIAVPETVVVDDPGQIESAVRQVGLPAVVKPAQSFVDGPDGGARWTSELVRSHAEAHLLADRLLAAGTAALFQEWVTGRREAVSLFRAEGRVRAEFAQVAQRMFPPLGGSSVLRESIPMPADVREASERLLEASELEGYAEVEFRRDRRGRGVLMEINPRLSASVEVAVAAGVDFPALVYRQAAGLPLPRPSGYRAGVRMRWLGGDLRWLRASLANGGHPEVEPPRRALGLFLGAFLRPTRYDYLSLADPLPALVATAGFTVLAARRAATRGSS